jgi:hypothetical protein
MKLLYNKLTVDRKKLAHWDRVQLTLFFKECGMSLDQAGEHNYLYLYVNILNKFFVLILICIHVKGLDQLR